MTHFITLMVAAVTMISSPLFGEIPQNSYKIMPPMNQIYHPVSTTNPEAQKSFDKGLSNIFAYNHDLAFREFENAAKQDPNLAMAYWGMALALGQNINEDVTPENEIKAYNYIQQAIKLSPKASLNEQDYISALAVRYTNDPKADFVPLRSLYKNAMEKLIQKYPEDLDAASMYAESILELDPWLWWTPDGKPRPGTKEAIEVLEFVLQRNPDHIGANHYYIHAWEESPFPERALMSAHRLEYLLPESGHLLHMPCHIFMLVGDYESALKTNQRAIAQDRKYIEEFGKTSGSYPLHYLKHNLYIMSRIYQLMEDYDNSIKASFDLYHFISPYFEKMPDLASFSMVPLEVYLYFHKWKEILEYPLPLKTPSVQAFWHFSRAYAYASQGNSDAAQKEKNLMLAFKKEIPSTEEFAMNPKKKILDLADIMIGARIANAQNQPQKYIELLQQAAKLEEQLNYNEPPAWYVPIQQVLGFAYLKQQKFVEAEEAFNNTLYSLNRNGRSLFGLTLSLKGQGRTWDAYWAEREMTAALKNASYKLQLEDF